jgi:2-C-methyl-D-erythritol 4-phosphate cytidylyltransferase
MEAEIPKQYLKLHGTTIIEHTLKRLASVPRISGVVVAVSADDPYWKKLKLPDQQNIIVTEGGEERCHSVLNGLKRLTEIAKPDDWVLVHDAARPCVRRTDIEKLIAQTAAHPTGGLLGMPVADTVKRVDDEQNVVTTVDRNGLWRALTPQLFRLGKLINAIENALAKGIMVTDEAAAIELAGEHPHMVEGCADNIKITRPADLELAEFFLQQQAASNNS